MRRRTCEADSSQGVGCRETEGGSRDSHCDRRTDGEGSDLSDCSTITTRLEALAAEIIEIAESLEDCVVTSEELALFRAAKDYAG